MDSEIEASKPEDESPNRGTPRIGCEASGHREVCSQVEDGSEWIIRAILKRPRD